MPELVAHDKPYIPNLPFPERILLREPKASEEVLAFQHVSQRHKRLRCGFPLCIPKPTLLPFASIFQKRHTHAEEHQNLHFNRFCLRCSPSDENRICSSRSPGANASWESLWMNRLNVCVCILIEILTAEVSQLQINEHGRREMPSAHNRRRGDRFCLQPVCFGAAPSASEVLMDELFVLLSLIRSTTLTECGCIPLGLWEIRVGILGIFTLWAKNKLILHAF